MHDHFLVLIDWSMKELFPLNLASIVPYYTYLMLQVLAANYFLISYLIKLNIVIYMKHWLQETLLNQMYLIITELCPLYHSRIL